jgi:hypothetical protein
MERTRYLLDRLDAIGRALANTEVGLALIGLGSCGLELDRLDNYSDLDFYAIVEEGAKESFVEDLGWLRGVAPIDYAFRNTADGYKLLFADGIFCEFAIFTPSELAQAAFAPGRVVWRRADVDPAIGMPMRTASAPAAPAEEWLAGEALTNLYVGLGRMRRGELLSAARFIQQYAVDRLIELAELRDAGQPVHRDPFGAERRVEQRQPGFAAELPQFVQGYARSRESALAILAYLEARVAVDPTLARAIRELAE